MTPKSRTLSLHLRNRSQTNEVNQILATRTTWHYKTRRPHLYLPPPHPFSCNKSFGQKENLSCLRLSSLSAGRWGILYLYTYTYTVRSGVFPPTLESNRMTLLGAGVTYLYYTPVLRGPLSNCPKFSFSKRRTCLNAGPVLKKTNLP